jgi:hypothetical protein
MHQASGTYCNIHSRSTPLDFPFLIDGLLSHITAQHTLHDATVLVPGDHGINSAQSSPLVTGLLVLTQHDTLTPSDSTIWASISVMTTSRGFGPSTFFLYFSMFYMSFVSILPTPGILPT